MSNPLHAAHYADGATFVRSQIVAQERMARDTMCVRLTAPHITRSAIPGQFVMLRIAGMNDPLLGRPLAVYNMIEAADGGQIDLVYLVKGKFTQRLSQLPAGAALEVWGPLGNGFSAKPVQHLILVAGGIGQTPFLTLGSEYLGKRSFGQPTRQVCTAQRVTLLYGARSAEYLAGVDDFIQAGLEVCIATDDGSRGEQGFVTQLLMKLLDEVQISTADGSAMGDAIRIACCGPEVMMEAVAKIATSRQVPCEVSLETPMACGIGICFTCVAKVKTTGDQWDYQRTCVEGPVFCADQLVW